MLASLNHPNIGSIYGLEEAEGVRALVLELIEGPTLADRIAQGPISLDEALPIAKQIAEALEAAHEQGVIHRDLKPANIKVKADGTVKVLDFGLAKAFQPDASDASASMSPTISLTAAATQMGMVIGTAAYMAPEQAKGKVVDKRADVWAFGVVLYEMLTGRRVFEGADATEVMAGVIKSDPEWAVLPDELSPTVVIYLKRCLKKDPQERLRDIGDVRLAMEGAFETTVTTPSEAGVAQPPQFWQRPVSVLSVLVIAVLASGLAVWNLRPLAPRPVSRFDYDLPDGHQLRRLQRGVVALSPDGRQFVYNTAAGLFVRSMDELDARLIPGTEANLTNPFFAPDGQSVGYFQDGQLKTIPVSGGAPVTLCEATSPFLGASWGRDGTILFGQSDGIMRVSANGGTPELVVTTEGAQAHHPKLLPGGEWVLFTLVRAGGLGAFDASDIVVQTLELGERKEVWTGAHARYVTTGHLVYAVGNTLFALVFDVNRLEVVGTPTPVVEDVAAPTSRPRRTTAYPIRDRWCTSSGVPPICADWSGSIGTATRSSRRLHHGTTGTSACHRMAREPRLRWSRTTAGTTSSSRTWAAARSLALRATRATTRVRCGVQTADDYCLRLAATDNLSCCGSRLMGLGMSKFWPALTSG